MLDSLRNFVDNSSQLRFSLKPERLYSPIIRALLCCMIHEKLTEHRVKLFYNITRCSSFILDHPDWFATSRKYAKRTTIACIHFLTRTNQVFSVAVQVSSCLSDEKHFEGVLLELSAQHSELCKQELSLTRSCNSSPFLLLS